MGRSIRALYYLSDIDDSFDIDFRKFEADTNYSSLYFAPRESYFTTSNPVATVQTNRIIWVSDNVRSLGFFGWTTQNGQWCCAKLGRFPHAAMGAGVVVAAIAMWVLVQQLSMQRVCVIIHKRNEQVQRMAENFGFRRWVETIEVGQATQEISDTHEDWVFDAKDFPSSFMRTILSRMQILWKEKTASQFFRNELKSSLGSGPIKIVASEPFG